MAKIAVIGDVMLDRYDYCLNRENPESSAPCYTVVRVGYKPGGAGNAAANLKSLGSDVDLIAVVGDDPHAGLLKKVLGEKGVSTRLIHDSSRETIVKERALSVGDGRYHFRLDHEKTGDIGLEHAAEVIQLIKSTGYELVLVSDYNKGMITRSLMEELKATKIPIIVDPKEAHKDFYEGVFVIKPNVKEARRMAGLDDEIVAAEKLREELGTNILLTRGHEGVIYFGLDGKRFGFPSQAKNGVFDVTGGGDTFIATFAHFYSKGRDIKECVELANKAAGIAVGYPGCYSVSEREVLES
ncbi:MAG: bifunctional hydroxymethylpyrimidine kinase/phosphomethylpyrimidine kinase [Nanoarchaeota archaeon]|nr:bifunctional hydroxymethylpyrimidine kinase/phosphomethylpyrimidine kinase [Nanoarchaeota archaeon]